MREELAALIIDLRAAVSLGRALTHSEVDDIERALAEKAGAEPHGYAYRYNNPFGGTEMRFNGGQEVNGGKPIEAVPYWLAAPPSQPVALPADLAAALAELHAAMGTPATVGGVGDSPYLGVVKLAAKRLAERSVALPDQTLCRFYGVDSWEALVAAQEEHVLKLQDAARRNVKPWEDTFPPTLLPKYLRESGLDAPRALPVGLPVAEFAEAFDQLNSRTERAKRSDLITQCAQPVALPSDLAAALAERPAANSKTCSYVCPACGRCYDCDKKVRGPMNECVPLPVALPDGWRAIAESVLSLSHAGDCRVWQYGADEDRCECGVKDAKAKASALLAAALEVPRV